MLTAVENSAASGILGMHVLHYVRPEVERHGALFGISLLTDDMMRGPMMRGHGWGVGGDN